MNTETKLNCSIIPDTQNSLQNTRLLASTGIPSLDNVIGGGLPKGSILLLEQDKFDFYAKIVLKYFMAEGIVTSQALLIASQDVKPSQFVSELPAVVNNESQDQEESENKTDEQMKIAWRYQDMKIDSSSKEHRQFGHFYDLTQKMQTNIFLATIIKEWQKCDLAEKNDVFTNPAYYDLLCTIINMVELKKSIKSHQKKENQMFRIVLHSLGSRLWLSDTEDATHHDLLKFFYCLKALLKYSYAVGLVTIAVDNFDDHSIIKRLEHMSDVVVRLEAFSPHVRESIPLYKNYHGFLHVKKLPALGTLACPTSPHKDLAFKLRRKQFTIEVIHLPPELDDTTEREQDESAGGCMSGSHKNPLDF